MNENELYHFGVKGMKWGVRRNRSSFVSTSGPKRLPGTYASDGNGWTAKAKRLPGAIVKKDGSFRTRRLQRAVNANNRDVKSLKSAGYKKEAAAVKAVGDKNRAKLAKSQARDAARNTPEAKAREKRLKKAALYGAAAASAIVTIHNLNKYKNSESMAKTVFKLAQIGTKFDKNPAGRLAREAIRSDRIAVGADIATGILQAGYGAVAVKSIYEIGKTYSGNKQRSNSK